MIFNLIITITNYTAMFMLLCAFSSFMDSIDLKTYKMILSLIIRITNYTTLCSLLCAFASFIGGLCVVNNPKYFVWSAIMTSSCIIFL